MATATIGNFSATGTWVNLVAETSPVNFSGLNAVNAVIQNFGSGSVCVWAKASGSAPTPDVGGIIIAPLDSVTVNAAQVWVKAMDGSATISATTI